MNTGRTMTMLLTGSPVYLGEKIRYKKPSRVQDELETKNILNCCSQEKDVSQETAMFSNGYTMRPIKDPRQRSRSRSPTVDDNPYNMYTPDTD